MCSLLKQFGRAVLVGLKLSLDGKFQVSGWGSVGGPYLTFRWGCDFFLTFEVLLSRII